MNYGTLCSKSCICPQRKARFPLWASFIGENGASEVLHELSEYYGSDAWKRDLAAAINSLMN